MKFIKILFLPGLVGLFFTSCNQKGNNNQSLKIEKMSVESSHETPSSTKVENKDFYNIPINDITGKKLDLTSFKGKKLMIVNVASECGYTPQYELLQKVYQEYNASLNILACPSNDFGGQEPGSPEEIVGFCKKNYGVTFPLTEKVGIKTNTHPLYQWLTLKDKNKVADAEVKWNFTKFLIDENGNFVKSLPSSVKPNDEQIIAWLKGK